MRLQDYLLVLRKRWWVIGLVALSSAVTAYGLSKLQRPTYRARATYSATINRADSGVYMFANQTLNNFIRLARNRTTFRAISQQLQLDVSAEKLLSVVRMQAQPNDLSIIIEADSPNTVDPPRIIDAVGQALIAKVAEKNRLAEGQDRVNIQPEEPDQVFKAKPNTKINTFAGGLLGLVLGLLLAFILEYLDDTVKTVDDVEQFIGLMTVGLIPTNAAMSATRRERSRPAVGLGLTSRKGVDADRQ